MANIKISELDELQKATDQDLLVIVDVANNNTKKIQAVNLWILVPKTTKTTSDTETYSCNYVNGIVESGSNENGNWIKYNDGTMICTKKHSGTANVNVALGSIFYNGYYAMAGDLPQDFIEAPYYYATNVESEWEIWGLQTKPVTTSKWATRVDLMSATSQRDKPITITMIAIGKWK